MEPTASRRTPTLDNRRAGDAPTAALIACGLWGIFAITACLSLASLFVVNRVWSDGVPQSLLFRMVCHVWVISQASGASQFPGLDFDPHGLSHYTNRDFDDAYLGGSAVFALALAAGLWVMWNGLRHDQAWARWGVVVLSSAAVAVIAAYGIWYASQGGPPEGLLAIALIAAVPAALGIASTPRATAADGLVRPRISRSRDFLIRPLILILMLAHACFVIPALACAWIVGGILVRQAWLDWIS